MTNELWKPVKGFEGFYEVSNKGRVRSTKPLNPSELKTTIQSIYNTDRRYNK